MELDVTQLTYLDTTDQTEERGENTTAIRFVWDGFVYTVFCFEGIIQYIGGQSHLDPLYDGSTATIDQAYLKDERRELLNGDHAPLQEWIDQIQ